MESDEFSLETTVPTDLSLSPDEISDFQNGSGDKRKKYSRQLYEKKQLAHDLQLLKIELSQKNLMLDNMKAENMQKVEELEENLSDALHQKQILQARLETELNIQQEESKRRQEKIQLELDAILRRQHQLESTNQRLQEKAGDVKRSIQNAELTEQQYHDLRRKNEDDIALRDFVAMKLYEAIKPLRNENEDMRGRIKSLTEALHKTKDQLNVCQEDLEEHKREKNDITLKHQKLTLAYADVKAETQQGDYKIENYERVKSERDRLEQDYTDIKKQFAYLEASYKSAAKERDDLSSEFQTGKQTISLLQKDKDFYSRQVHDLGLKLKYNEERVMQLTEQLDRAKESREELYDKYVDSRDQYKSEYEAKLREELEQIRVRTNTEIDRLKTSTREMYERENRNLREARDMALSEKDRAQATEKETNTKYEQLVQDFRHLQVRNDNKMSELQNEVKIRSFESERTQMVYEETCRTLKECQTENEKIQKKLDVLTKEYYMLQTGMEKRVSELESTVNEKNVKLETYERLEQELDDVVMQAADVEEEEEAERVLFSYGYGANVPTTAKRRLKQSVHLARRVLQLERANTSMRKEVEREADRTGQLAEELKEANQLLNQSQQPYHYLIESIKGRDAQLAKQKEHLTIMEGDIKRLQKERASLSKAKNQLSLDLEKLLNQREEMQLMKHTVLSMSRKGTAGLKTKTQRSPKLSRPHHKKAAVTSSEDSNIHKPGMTQFTAVSQDGYRQFQHQAKNGRMMSDRSIPVSGR